MLGVIAHFSKSCRLLTLKGLLTAMVTAKLLFNSVFRYYGIPEVKVSDRGPQFISRLWKAFYTLLGVTGSLSSGYHPQSNVQTERKIGHFLRTFCHGHWNSWNQFLDWVEYAQNSLRQPSTGLTPFQCILGYQPPLLPWSGEPSDVLSVDYWFRESETVWDAAHHQHQRAVRRQKMTADLRRSEAPSYQPGQEVWLSTRDIRMRLPCKKLMALFHCVVRLGSARLVTAWLSLGRFAFPLQFSTALEWAVLFTCCYSCAVSNCGDIIVNVPQTNTHTTKEHIDGIVFFILGIWMFLTVMERPMKMI